MVVEGLIKNPDDGLGTVEMHCVVYFPPDIAGYVILDFERRDTRAASGVFILAHHKARIAHCQLRTLSMVIPS